jgi:hypothetical protein
MNDLRKAAEMALEFVSWFASDDHSIRPKHKAPEIAEALRQALDDKPAVKTYCGGIANYCTPVDAVNMSQDRVDETAKGEHEPVGWLDSEGRFSYFKHLDSDEALYTAPSKREWVGLTGDEVNEFASGCHLGISVQDAIRKAEAKLKEKNA